MTEPASIRYKNPGAMWPGKRATKWGSKTYVNLNDGQGNKIAVFPTFVQGAAAQFDLWASNYTGMTLKAAIDKWSGHNSPREYVQFLEANTGVGINTRVTRELLASPVGWKLLKAQSRWEAGRPIPMTDAEWQEAQRRVFSGARPAASTVSKSAGSVAVGGAAATAAHQAGLGVGWIVAIGVAVAVAAFLAWKFKK